MAVAAATFALDGTTQLRYGRPGFWWHPAYHCPGRAPAYIDSLYRLYLFPGRHRCYSRFSACQTHPTAFHLRASNYWSMVVISTTIRAAGSGSQSAHTWGPVSGRLVWLFSL